jgi:hypothetical protein
MIIGLSMSCLIAGDSDPVKKVHGLRRNDTLDL